MTAKLIAGLLIVIASVFLSNGIGESYREKRKFYTDFLRFIEYAQNEIDVYNLEFDYIISKFKEGREKTLFVKCLTGEKKAIEGEKLLQEYLKGITATDKSGQKKFSKSISDSVRKELQQAELKEKKNGDITKKIIPLTGIAIFILLL